MRIRRRPRSRDLGSFLGLDSFMDIVTNVIGALFFVIIYAALASAGAKGKVTALMVSPGDTEAIFFECRHNTVLFPEINRLMQEANREWEQTKEDEIASLNERVERLKEAKIGNSFCTYIPEINLSIRGGRIIWELLQTFVPVPGSRGENADELEKADSAFRRELAKLDPDKHHIYFVVRVDSFEVFHAARQLALKQGFRAGWNPIEADAPIAFGSGGINPDPEN